MIGLDCASPALWLERWRSQLPTFESLLDGASYGTLRSVHPPITIPAWASMLSGRDPGSLGLYGFRSRRSRGGLGTRLNDARDLTQPLLWDLFGRSGARCVVVGFPPSYPPRRVPGRLVSGMLTPTGTSDWTWPPELRGQVNRWAEGEGGYAFDAEAHRVGNIPELVEQVTRMTRTRFGVFRNLLRDGDWNLAFLHEIGLDRIQHALWDGLEDEDGEKYAQLLTYHQLLDDELGETLECVGLDCQICVVSDHGARRFEGSFRINEWLRREGWLKTTSKGEIDWTQTRASADGGYCARIYLNLAGREPQGALPAGEYELARQTLREQLEDLHGPDGAHLGSASYLPEEVYAHTSALAPDLLFYPGDLALRCAEGFGDGSLLATHNDTGPDCANHDWEGLFVLRDPAREGAGRLEGTHLLDIAPTLCERSGMPVPGWMAGRVIA